MKYGILTREEVELLIDNVTSHGRNKLIAFKIEWWDYRKFSLKVITEGKFYETNEKRIGVDEYKFVVEDEVKYSEYLSAKTRLKFIVSSGCNWNTSIDDYFDSLEWK